MLVISFHPSHFESGGVGALVVAHTQSRPLHLAVLDALNLPPLTNFFAVGSLLPTGAQQGAKKSNKQINK